MALAATNDRGFVTASSGNSDHIVLPEGALYLISFSSDGDFIVDLQVESGKPGKWDDAYEGDLKTTIDSSSGRQNAVASAGNYRFSIVSATADVTMYARRT